jgi:hypothetical protein
MASKIPALVPQTSGELAGEFVYNPGQGMKTTATVAASEVKTAAAEWKLEMDQKYGPDLAQATIDQKVAAADNLLSITQERNETLPYDVKLLLARIASEAERTGLLKEQTKLTKWWRETGRPEQLAQGQEMRDQGWARLSQQEREFEFEKSKPVAATVEKKPVPGWEKAAQMYSLALDEYQGGKRDWMGTIAVMQMAIEGVKFPPDVASALGNRAQAVYKEVNSGVRPSGSSSGSPVPSAYPPR